MSMLTSNTTASISTVITTSRFLKNHDQPQQDSNLEHKKAGINQLFLLPYIIYRGAANYTENEAPHPQVEVAFGFLTTNIAPSSSSVKSTSEPARY